MAVKYYKLVAAVRVAPITTSADHTTVWTKDGAGGWVKATQLTEGLQYIAGDGTTDDLLLELQTNINASLPTSTVSLSVITTPGAHDSGGLVRVTNNGPNQIQISKSDQTAGGGSGDDIFDWFRWSGTTLIINSGSSSQGSYTHAGGFYPPRIYLMEDRSPYTMPPGRQLVPDEGNIQTLTVASGRRRKVVGIRIDNAFDRSATSQRNDYYSLKNLWQNYLTIGRPCRLYADRDEVSAFSEGTNHWGYETFTYDRSGGGFDPDIAFGSWHYAWDAELEGWEYTP